MICSLHFRGLKRRKTFNRLRNKKYSVYFCKKCAVQRKQKNYGWLNRGLYRGLFSSLSSSGASVSVLFSNNFSIEIQKYLSDPKGRFITIDIKTEDKIITPQNIYAPNNDDPNFFKSVFNNLSTCECEHLVLGGDFNCSTIYPNR